MKKLAYAVATLTILLVLMTTVNSTAAADYTKIGVEVGDTADYRYSSTFGYNGSHILVWGILGPTVYINQTLSYPNGTSIKDQIVGNFHNFLVYLVAGNLSVGDHL